MKPFVTAVVIADGDSDYLSVTLAALQQQTRPAERILIVDTSTEGFMASEASNRELPEHIEIRSIGPIRNLAQAVTPAAESLPSVEGATNWMWLLHDDSAPAEAALAELLNTLEISPSVALVGPKQLEWNDPRIIKQLGLTLTRRGAIFSPVAGELDQAQHDHIDDVMAVGTAGMLVNADVYRAVGGIDPKVPNLAADVDFSVRVRLAGHRVAVAPAAKVLHAGLSLAGKRNRRWLKAGPRTAMRRATAHLKIAYSSFLAASLYVLFAPLIGILRAIWAVASKHPNRIWAEVSTGFWVFFTGFARLAARARVRRGASSSLSSIDALRASRQAVRQQRLHEQVREDAEIVGTAPLAPEGAVDATATKASSTTVALWIALALALASWRFIPFQPAAIGGGALPLSGDWYTLFTHAGSSFQNIGLGFYGASDPFNWVLLAIGSLTPWQPSLGLALFLLLAKSLSFLGAWRALGLLTARGWLRILGALAFAFWPSISQAQIDARVPSIVAAVALPWLTLAVARAAGLGKNAPRRSASRTWSWVGVSGLLLMVVGAAAPNVLPALILAMFVVLFSRLGKFGYLFWIPLPLGAALAPLIWFESVNLLQPAASLADPGLPQTSRVSQFWQLLLGDGLVNSGIVDASAQAGGATLTIVFASALWITIPILLLAIIALLSSRFVFASSLWALVVFALACAWLVERISFAAIGVGSSQIALDRVNGSPYALLALAAMGLIALAVIALDQINRAVVRRSFAVLTAVATVAPAAALFAVASPTISFTNGRVVPSLVAAETSNGSQLKTLVLRDVSASAAEQRFAAELVSGDGVQLDDVSTAYRFALSGLAEERDEYGMTGQLVADLTAANGTDLTTELREAGIGFILSPETASAGAKKLAIALDSSNELESAGQTDYGRLWRVKSPNADLAKAPTEAPSPWSITKVVQLVVILGFVLLAVPGRAAAGKRNDSEIFVGQTDEPTGGDDFV
ncbi:MAG: hypothetical protein RLZZ304_620 [Actinomycetota bacterium]